MSVEIADLTMSAPYTGATDDRCIRLNSGGWKRKLNTGSTRHEVASWTASGYDRTLVTATPHGAAVGDIVSTGYTSNVNIISGQYRYGVVTHVDSPTQIRYQSSLSYTGGETANGEYIVIQKWRILRFGWRFCTPSSLSSFNPSEILFFGLSCGDYPFASPSLVKAVGVDLGETGYSTWTRTTDATYGDRYSTTNGSVNKIYLHSKQGAVSNSWWGAYFPASWTIPAARQNAGALLIELEIATIGDRPYYSFNLCDWNSMRDMTKEKFTEALQASTLLASSSLSSCFGSCRQGPTNTYYPDAQLGLMETMEVSWPRTDPPFEILDYGWNIVARQ